MELNDDPENLAYLGQAYARAGRRDEAQKILARLTEEAKSRYVSAYSFAVLFLALGEKDRAFYWLEHAYAHRDMISLGEPLDYIMVNPMVNPLRSDPRFKDLVRRMGLPP